MPSADNKYAALFDGLEPRRSNTLEEMDIHVDQAPTTPNTLRTVALQLQDQPKAGRRETLRKQVESLPGVFSKKKLTRTQARKRIAFIKKYAQWLDAIPGLPIPIGIDGIIGLIPGGIGDVSAGGLSLLLIYLARDLHLPQSLHTRMLANVGLETVVGSMPLVGDMFDFWFKANLRNLKHIETWFEKNAHLFPDGEE